MLIFVHWSNENSATALLSLEEQYREKDLERLQNQYADEDYGLELLVVKVGRSDSLFTVAKQVPGRWAAGRKVRSM